MQLFRALRPGVPCGLIGVVLLLGGAESATASCRFAPARDQLREASAAFIGTVVGREGDIVTYEVTEPVKGGLGSRVAVRDAAAGSSVGIYDSDPVRPVALFLDGEASSGYSANGCMRTTPDRMRAAARSGRLRCAVPRVARLRVSRTDSARRYRLEATVQDADGSLRSLRITWGDGSSTTVSFRGATTASRTVRPVHTYRRDRRGRRAVIKVTAFSTAPLDCSTDLGRLTTETSRTASRSVRVR